MNVIRPEPTLPLKIKKPDTHSPDRRCTEQGCDVKLGIYNPGPNCYRHSPLKYPRVRGRTR